MADVMATLNSCLTSVMSNNSKASAPANSPAGTLLTYQI
jgi:hypothetical protein